MPPGRRRRRVLLLAVPLLALAMLVTGLPALPVLPAARPARAATGDAVDLLTPVRLVRSNGAELEWTRYTGPSGAPFDRYEVHRSATAGFTPSASTLLATIRDRDVTRWRDTTAAPSTAAVPARAFYYKVVANTSPSVEVGVTMPTAGQATLTLQPDAAAGKATYVVRDRTTPVDCYDWYNYGAATNLRVGTHANGVVHRPLLRFDLRDIPAKAAVASATMTLAWPATTAPLTLANRGVNLHRVTRTFQEGTGTYPGQCNGTGAAWNESQGGVRWGAGGDIDGTADVTTAPKARSTVGASGFGTDTFNVLGLVREWVNGDAPNHGMLLKLADDATIPTDGPYFDYHADDATNPAARPKLVVTFTDNSASLGPRAAVATPGPNATVAGATVKLAAAAGDDRRVDRVEFLVDGAVVGSDTAPPFETTWNSTTVAGGQHAVTVRATDDVGNATSSSAVSVKVDNTAAPTGALTAPAQGAVVRGTAVTLSATASDDVGVKQVEFLVDGVRVGPPDTTSPYSVTWNTLHPLATVYDGGHQVQAHITDTSGQEVLTAARTVTVDNRAASQYRADFKLNDPATTTDDVVPQLMTENTSPTAPLQDPYGGTTNPDGTSGGSLGKLITSPPTSAALTTSAPATPNIDPAPAPCPADAYCPTVTVTNTSTVDWKNNTGLDLRVWYRWYAPNGAVLFEGPAFDNFPNNFQAGATKTFPLTILPPRLPPGAELGEYRLRIDLYDVPTASWFSGRGNQPIDHPILVVKNLEEKLGLERFWHYDAEDAGAGMSTLTNVANGNMLLRWSPFFIPGRGLSTMVDLTYNSLEDHSESPAGENFSLSLSGLTRLGAPLDIHPNKADEISGKSNKWVEFIDGDGTTHRFTGTTLTDGSTRWTEPPGVNLYLRSIAANPADRRWALTRPDNVTFYFDVDGFPTAVVDRNGNTLRFVLEDTPPGEDPGGPKRRVIRVVAPGTPGVPDRQVTIDYWSKAEARKAHVRGKIQRITDHTGSALDFDYYDDGNLLRLTQRGGTKANGEHLADRTFVFTYTTSAGDGPAIDDYAARGNPDPKTPNQSTRIYSVRDPRDNETSYSYFRANEAAHLRWKLKSRTNRSGNTAANRVLNPNPYTTTFAYDLTNRVTTVTEPPLTAPRATRYAYDTDGKVVRLTNPKNETTQVLWSPDFKVLQVTEPTGKFTSYTYNANGSTTSQTNQLGQRTELTYLDQAVDAADVGRHLSLLSTTTSPKGVASPAVGDFQWRFTYDGAGNPDKVTDPSGAVTDYDYNLAGSAAPGTLAVIRDAKGNPPTSFPVYDFSGQPSEMVDPLGNRTRFAYDGDGLLRWVQDANHATVTGTDERSYKSFLDYDAFHRLGRQSAPKSTSTDRGTLIWSSVDFDPNDNVVRRVEPHYGSAVDDGRGGAAGSATFDEMDLPLVVATSDTSVDSAGERTAFAYDTAGRLVKTTRPKGVLTSTADDYTTLYAYDTLDRQIRKTDLGATTNDKRTTHLCYDLAGDLRSVTSPRAGLDTVTCPGTGPLTGAGFTATYAYDAAHRLVAQTDPLGHERRVGYDANGNTTSQEADIATGRASRVTIDYDPRNLPITVTQRFDGTTGRNVVNRIEYDANGNRSRLISARAVDAAGGTGTFTQYVTGLQYDALDRLTLATLPFDTRDGTERQYIHHAYDPNGNLLSTSLPVTSASPGAVQASARRSMTYFDPGWVRTSDDPSNPKIHYDYAAQGWQTRQVPERKDSPGTLDTSRTMTWEYFNDAQLKERKDNGGHPSTYAYDADNNLTSALDAAGVTDPGDAPMETEATYTGFDEVAKVRHRKKGATTWTFTDYVYDANGNVAIRRENGQEDGAGAQTKAPRRHELTYDQADWLTRQLDLGTDAACKDDQRIENLFWSTGWERQRDSYRAGTGCSSDPTTWPKKKTTTWEHFDNGKLKTLVTRNGSGTVTESHEVGYFDDAGIYVNGNRTRDRYVLERASSSGATTCRAGSPCDAKYVYDARDKLLRHQQRAGKETVYSLDEPDKLLGDKTVRAGNVTTETKGGQSTTRKYTGDQLTELSIGGVVGKYWYDQLGNLDCITLAAGTQANCSPSDGGASANLVTDFAYDYLNRLAGTRSFSGGSTRTDRSDYTYDALDRVTKEVEDHAGSGNDRTTTMTHQGLSNLVTEEKQAGGTNPKTKSFSYDAYGHRMSMTSTDNATGTAETFDFGHDVHGSVSQLISDTGTVRASYGYDAYGGSDAPSSDPEALTTGDTDSQAPLNPYRYSGKRMDSGLATGSGSVAGYDMGARRFGPDTTRFLQQDMFASALGDLGLSLDPLTQNRYALAGGNPISYVETDGHVVTADGGGGGSPSPSPTSGGSSSGDGYDDPTNFWVDSYRSISEQKTFPRSQLVARIRQDYVEGIKKIRAQAIARAKSSGDWEAAARWGVEQRNQLKHRLRDQTPIVQKYLPRIRGEADTPSYQWLADKQLRRGTPADQVDERIVNHLDHHNQGYTRFTKISRWAGRAGLGLDVAFGGYNIATAKPEDRAEVIGGEVGRAAGAWGGRIAGAALAGAALGSVVPGAGTAVGAAVGVTAGIIGAVGGGWLGEKAGSWIGGKLEDIF